MGIKSSISNLIPSKKQVHIRRFLYFILNVELNVLQGSGMSFKDFLDSAIIKLNSLLLIQDDMVFNTIITIDRKNKINYLDDEGIQLLLNEPRMWDGDFSWIDIPKAESVNTIDKNDLCNIRDLQYGIDQEILPFYDSINNQYYYYYSHDNDYYNLIYFRNGDHLIETYMKLVNKKIHQTYLVKLKKLKNIEKYPIKCELDKSINFMGYLSRGLLIDFDSLDIGSNLINAYLFTHYSNSREPNFEEQMEAVNSLTFHFEAVYD